MLRAKVSAFRKRLRDSRQRERRSKEVEAKRASGALVGDLAWRSNDGAMDVDESLMQRFLDSDQKFKTQFSVQDMLEGRISVEDPLEDLLD